jgi:hypothetical protein
MIALFASREFQRRGVIALCMAWLVAMAGLVLAACLTGCGPSALAIHAGAADVAGVAINASGEELLAMRGRALEEAVDEAPSREVAENAVQVVVARFLPALDAYDALRLTHDAYVDALVLAAAGAPADIPRWSTLASRLVTAWGAWAAVGRSLGVDVVGPPAALLSVTAGAGGAL